jgi:hypothetical protein
MRQRPAMRNTAPDVEHVDWPVFLTRMRWRQGEHVSLIGPTGTGKTTLMFNLLPMRRYTAVIGTKPRDTALSDLERSGYVRRPDLPERGQPSRVLIWPPYRTPEDRPRQRVIIRDALRTAFRAGGWCTGGDEVSYLCRRLRLEDELLDLWEQGRSNGCTVVAATQRPAWVPLALYSQASHLFFWRTRDGRDLARIAGLNGVDPVPVRAAVAALPRHHALYVNAVTGDMVTTIAPRDIPRV